MKKTWTIFLLTNLCFISLVSEAASNQSTKQLQVDKDAERAENKAFTAQILSKAKEQGSPWFLLSGGLDGAKYYVNAETIKSESPPYTPLMYEDGSIGFTNKQLRLWWKFVEEDGSYTQVFSYIYCDKGLYRSIDGAGYTANHLLISHIKTDKFVKAIMPGTTFATISKFACKFES